eukprot:TRINITY_DN10953_c0_g1_i2.p1 TRINITY_DN10953_c0_g1~~TRINITY_DN10953_c0_g1_i2.p1  ORF type:complete len:191 (-),score=51.43 TRINITY_DN10953_c0_g1_i2:287-781(-)
MGYKKRIPAAMVDFNFNINLLFPQEISSVRNDLIPSGFQGGSGNAAVVRRQVATVLDVLGEQSARAQGLKNPITSGNKMLNAEDQAAYILVDRFGNNGMGSVVGLLKVGRKKLFLWMKLGNIMRWFLSVFWTFMLLKTDKGLDVGRDCSSSCSGVKQWILAISL